MFLISTDFNRELVYLLDVTEIAGSGKYCSSSRNTHQALSHAERRSQTAGQKGFIDTDVVICKPVTRKPNRSFRARKCPNNVSGTYFLDRFGWGTRKQYFVQDVGICESTVCSWTFVGFCFYKSKQTRKLQNKHLYFGMDHWWQVFWFNQMYNTSKRVSSQTGIFPTWFERKYNEITIE